MNLKNKHPGLESPGILLKVLESPEILNSEKLKSLQKWYLLINKLPFLEEVEIDLPYLPDFIINFKRYRKCSLKLFLGNKCTSYCVH